jgi:CPA2 family monovalent cation:H+ antiporter-2
VVSVSLGAFLTGNGIRTSVQAGMSLAQIGEFSFIIAALGLSLGATRDFVYPVAVAVSALTTLITPWLIRAAPRVGGFIDRKLPRPLQTFASLYGSWVERLRTAPRRKTAGATVRRLALLLLLDAAILAAVVIGVAVEMDGIVAALAGWIGLEPGLTRTAVVVGAFAISLPFLIGVFRIARKLGVVLAELALPPAAGGKADLGAAPRRVLIVTLQLASLLLVGAPLIALIQPFVPSLPAALVLVLIVAFIGVAFWRSAANLHGHVRAGAQVVADVLASQSASPPPPSTPAEQPAPQDPLHAVHDLMPGLGEPVSFRLEPHSRAVGKSLAELNLRGVTGTTVLAITRAGGDVLLPSAREILRAGDILALAGTQEAIAAARELLG